MAIPSPELNKRFPMGGMLGFLGITVVAFIGYESLIDLVSRWLNEEAYGHGFLLPVISLYLFVLGLEKLPSRPPQQRYLGVIGFSFAMAALVLSEGAQIHTLSHYIVLVLTGCLAIAAWGTQVIRILIAPLLLVLFAIPLPAFLQAIVTADLQLLSSQFGVAILKLIGVPVFLEGNVIDMGTYKLQVVEACAGLNYLYPLMGISFLCSCFLKTPMWQRALVVVSAIPITILLNCVRIALSGYLVQQYGNEAAEGFIHAFEGWILFVVCLLLTIGLIGFFARFVNHSTLNDDFAVNLTYPKAGIRRLLSAPANPALWFCCGLSIFGLGVSYSMARSDEIIPDRPAFAIFPDQLGSWSGSRHQLPSANLTTLNGLSDYLLSFYRSPTETEVVELYVAYYESQKASGGAHSPKVCLPAGDWDIRSLKVITMPSATGDVRLNRVVIQRGLESKLVYYWFQQGGNTFASEFAVKFDMFRRSILENSTNGAMVRIATSLTADEDTDAADIRLTRFWQSVSGKIGDYVPTQDLPAL